MKIFKNTCLIFLIIIGLSFNSITTYADEKKHTKESTQFSLSKNEKPLYSAYYGFFGNEALYKVCEEFNDSNHELSQMVDDTIGRNYKNIESRLLEEVKKASECSNVNSGREKLIKQHAYDKFIKSRTGSMLDIALKAGPHLYTDPDEAYSRVNGCNSYSRKIKLMYENLKNKPVTCDTVK